MTGATVAKNFIQQVFLLPKLIIPYYQRPYSWEAGHVLQLLDEINESYYKTERSVYRIGTVILHEDGEGHLNIEDGQQRLKNNSWSMWPRRTLPMGQRRWNC